MTLLAGVYGSRNRALEAAERLGLTPAEQFVVYTPLEQITSRCEGSQAAVIWATTAPGPEAAVVDAWGRRGLFAFNNSGCPRSPDVRKRLLEAIEAAAARECSAVVLDGIRYSSPHDDTLLLSCFCSHCIEASLGLEKIRRKILDATARKDPSLLAEALRELAEARAQAVEEAIVEARDIARQHGLRVEAAVFPPSLAQLVGQRLDWLSRLLDRLQIMLYHRCSGPACHNHEHASLQRLLRRLGQPLVEALELLGIAPPADPETLEAQGTPPAVLAEEWRRAVQLASGRAVPILWLDERLPEVLGAVRPLAGEVVVFTPEQG